MFGGLVFKAQAHRGQTEGGGGRDQHRGAVSSVGVPPPGDLGAPAGRGSQDASLLVSQSASSGRPPAGLHP